MSDNCTLSQKKFDSLCGLFARYKVPFLSALFIGLMAHGFAFTNKLLNADEVSTLFGKGEHLASGRWGLLILSYIFPDVSMPYIYGILSIIIVAIAICLIVHIFYIKTPVMQAVLAAVIISFPAQAGVFCFMFASTSYAVAFLLSVLSAYIFVSGKKLCWLLSSVALVLSLGIYQAYLAVTASLLLLVMIQRLLTDEGYSTKEIFLFGLKGIAVLFASVVLWAAISYACVSLSGGSLIDYAVNTENSFLYKILLAYSSFFKTITNGYFEYVNTSFSAFLHILCAIVVLAAVVIWFRHVNEWPRRLLLLLCVFLLPLSINCMYLVAVTGIIHSVVLHGFISVYILAAVVDEYFTICRKKLARDILAISMLLVCISNVYFCNKVYLKMYLQYEQAYSFYTSLVTQIRMTEGYSYDSEVALIGEASYGLTEMEQLDLEYFNVLNDDLINIYTKKSFIKYYIGVDLKYADNETCQQIKNDSRYQQMPQYPSYGSVANIDGVIVVKLS